MVSRCSDAAPLGRAASVVRDGRDVGDRAHLESGSLERPDGLLPTGAGSLDVDLDLAHAVLHGAACRSIRRKRGSIRRALPGALEPGDASGTPRDDIPGEIRDRHDRVVEARQNVDVSLGDVLPLPAPLLDGALSIGHALAVPRHFVFFRAPTVFFGPRRARAFVLVRCPRTGRLRRCRSPRYDPISMRRLMFSATSRRRSPSTLNVRSMTSRSRLTWSSVRSRTRVSGLTFVCFRIFWLDDSPTP